MAGIIEPELEKYFHFLTTEHGFEKKEEYSIAREVFNDYFKKGILIKFIFDGTLRVNIREVKDYSQSNNFSERNFRKLIGVKQQFSNSYLERLYNEEGHFKEQVQIISESLKKNLTHLEVGK